MVDQRGIDDQHWIDAAAAATRLGIQRRTLYAYVSRGQVRSVPGARGRPRLYAVADLDRLRVRRDARAGHGAVAAGALRWGEPVLDSAITAITPRGPAYRGHLAVDLAAAGWRFENVAELLWSGYLPPQPVTWPRIAAPPAALARVIPAGATPIDAMRVVVDAAALADADRHDGRPDAFIARARRLIPLLALTLAPDRRAAARARTADGLAGMVVAALGLAPAGRPAIDTALIVLADHELNASSFAARVAASTEADPYACVSAALATLSGPRHGRAPEAVAAFADEVTDARATVRALRRRGLVPPGFGHPLYPAGDPRTAPLLALARGSGHRRARTLLALVEATRDAAPSVDIGLAALVAALGAPASVGPGLFAIARSAGWLAHAIEQRAAGFLLRPRARYTGVAPVTADDASRGAPVLR